MGQGESADRARCSPPGRSNVVLGGSSGRLAADYELGRRLADGQLGVIRVCTSKHTGERFACKSIQKSSLWSVGAVEDVRREIRVMKLVIGHPNIVELKAVYEDQECVHLVMELCEGGELFDYITEKKEFSEHEAAHVCVTLMEVLRHCHSRGVIHRDLKPENLLLSSKKSLFPVKVADFGLAVNTQQGKRLSGMAGSAYYIAPEVLEGDYGKEIDVWSAGVVLYILLSGVPPFWDETEEGIFNAIRGGQLDLHSGRWLSLSSEVKDLLRGMLCSDVQKRFTPEQVLNHRWIKRHSGSETMNIFSRESCNSSDDFENASHSSKLTHSPVADESVAAFLPDLTHSSKFRAHNDSDDPTSYAPAPPIKAAVESQQLAWSSPAPNPTSSDNDFLTTESSFQQPSHLQIQEAGCTMRSVWEREKMVVDTAEGKFVQLVQENERGRMGWKKIIEDDEESPMSLGLNRLLFSSSPTSTPTQPHSCRPQPVY